MNQALFAQDLCIEKKSPGGEFSLSISELTIYRGEVLVILGPNGAGKSTLLRTLAGVEEPSSGLIQREPSDRITMVFQRPIALAGSVLHNVRIALRAQGMRISAADQASLAALEHFGIAHLSGRPASDLSGGELRRLALARAFALEPAVLLLDEPFDDLDGRSQEALSLDLRNAVARTGTAVVVVTHDIQRASLLSDRMAVLLHGGLSQIGTPREILNRPIDFETAELVGMSNLIAADLDAQGIAHVDAERRIPTAVTQAPGPVYVGLRPEHLKLDLGRGEGQRFGEGQVMTHASDGRLTTVSLDWGGEILRTHLISGRGLGHIIQVGDRMPLSIRPEDAHVLPRTPP
ncbi:MAG: ABC transporter ATP-binding protein [Myxococcota bacterium]|nr:ABC transporter ATP-binding protein [Myxococcota bacterium]